MFSRCLYLGDILASLSTLLMTLLPPIKEIRNSNFSPVSNYWQWPIHTVLLSYEVCTLPHIRFSSRTPFVCKSGCYGGTKKAQHFTTVNKTIDSCCYIDFVSNDGSTYCLICNKVMGLKYVTCLTLFDCTGSSVLNPIPPCSALYPILPCFALNPMIPHG
jgi:hypothetical protein